MLFSNKVYNTIKFLALFVLPFIGVLYFIYLGIFGVINEDVRILGGVLSLILFLSSVMTTSSNSYFKSGKDTDGVLQIEKRELKDIYRLQLNSDLEDLGEKKRIILVVDPKAKISD